MDRPQLREMWLEAITFAYLVNFVATFIGVYEAQVGSRLRISLGPEVVTWKRVRHEGVEEFIKHCDEGVNEPRCFRFVTADDRPALPESSNATVLANGTLLIEVFKKTDVGTYSSPDLKPKEYVHPDGTTAKIHPSIIFVEEKE
ncbi:hypothetical protein OSTOST_01986 [Ostertagia ostertagi]